MTTLATNFLTMLGSLHPLGQPEQLGTAIGDLNRRQGALERYQILEARYRDVLERRVRAVYQDPDVTRGMLHWSDTATAVNPALDITRALAVVYRRPPVRQFLNSDAATEVAWTKVARLARINQQGKTINRLAYGIGPVLMLPTLMGGKPRLEYHPPHRYDVHWDPADRHAPPLAVAIDLRPGFNLWGRAPSALEKDQPALVIVDAEAWHYFNAQGKPVAGPAGLEVDPHGIKDASGDPVCPAVFFRVDEPSCEDWWSRSRASRIFTATIACGVIWCRWRYVRQYQDSKQLVSKIPSDAEIVQGVVIGHPAQPLEVKGDQATAASLEVVDYNQTPFDWLMEINATISAAALGEGLPAEAVTLSAPLDAGRMPGTRMNSTGLTERLRNQHRQDQLGYAVEAETKFAERMISLLHVSGSEFAAKLPPVDEVADRYTIEWPNLASSDDPQQQREDDDFQLKRGLKSRVDLIQDRFPHLSRAQCMDVLIRNAKENAAVDLELTRSNQTRDPRGTDLLDPGDSPTPAEANGALGPMIRDGDIPDE